MADPDHIGKCGMRTSAVIREILRWPVDSATADAIGEEKEALYRHWIATRGISPVPGVLDFLAAARSAGIRCAVATSASRANLDACLSALSLQNAFCATVTGEEVPRGKPAPDIFALAASRTGIPPSQCLAFEDSPAGVSSAHAAGIPVVALLTSHTPSELASADLLSTDFTPLVPVLCGNQ